MASTNYTLAAGYRAFVEQISGEIFTKLFYSFRTAELVTIHEGVKGKKVWTEMTLRDLAKRYASTFSAEETNELKPVELIVHANKVEHKEVPQDMEDTYLGFLRRNEFNHQDWPLERFTIMKLIEKLQQEFENAVWQGVEEAAAAGQTMAQTFNGFLKIITDAITAGDLTPTTTGPITTANIIGSLRTMYGTMNPEMKQNGFDILMSYANFDKYLIALDDQHPGSDVAYVEVGNAGYNGVRYRQGGGNVTIIPIAGMGDSDRILMIPRDNLHMGIDALSDWGNFNFEQQVRELLYWMDFKIGVTITLLQDGLAAVNDQA